MEYYEEDTQNRLFAITYQKIELFIMHLYLA